MDHACFVEQYYILSARKAEIQLLVPAMNLFVMLAVCTMHASGVRKCRHTHTPPLADGFHGRGLGMEPKCAARWVAHKLPSKVHMRPTGERTCSQESVHAAHWRAHMQQRKANMQPRGSAHTAKRELHAAHWEAHMKPNKTYLPPARGRTCGQ